MSLYALTQPASIAAPSDEYDTVLVNEADIAQAFCDGNDPVARFAEFYPFVIVTPVDETVV